MKVFFSPLAFWRSLYRGFDIKIMFPYYARTVKNVSGNEPIEQQRSVMIEMLRQHTDHTKTWTCLNEGDRIHLLVSIAMKHFPVKSNAYDSEEIE